MLEILATALFSGIVATSITLCFYYKQEKKRRKLDLLENIMRTLNGIKEGNEDSTRHDELCGYLNSIYIAFGDNQKVLDNLTECKKKKKLENDDLVTLIKSMCDDLKIKRNKLNDSFITKIF